MRSAFWNAFAAAAYIVVVATGLFYAPHLTGDRIGVLVPIVMLSLFVLSAAIMGFLFVYQPVLLYMEGKKKESATLLLHTIGIFAGFTVLFLAAGMLLSV